MTRSMRVFLERRIGTTTDDPEEAFQYLQEKRREGEDGWDMAEVRFMEDPPRTVHKWCVFRITSAGGTERTFSTP
jgi:hypothetical protein